MNLATRCAPFAATLALCLAGVAAADDATPVTLEVGKAVNLCKAGLAACPATTFLCDDPGVARIENGSDGPELKAISPGATLCSLLGPGRAFRRLLRVTVTAPASPPGRAP